MDVKWGTGAFMKTQAQAEELATWLAETAAKSGLKTTAFITDMNQPLGRFVGNAIEVLECLSIFKNEPVLGWDPKTFADTVELSLRLSAEMLCLSGHSTDHESAYNTCANVLKDGRAYKKFVEMCEAQGGNLQQFHFPTDLSWDTLSADSAGFIDSFDGESMGYGAIALGAGRKQTTDIIDPFASIIVHKKRGERVAKGDVILSYTSKELSRREAARPLLQKSFVVGKTAPPSFDLIFKKISVQ